MNKPTHHFNFKPATESDRELIHGWLQQDYIQEWIHGQGLQNTLSGLEKFIQHPALDRQTTLTQHWIGYDNDIPFIYLLTTNVDPDSEYAKYSDGNGAAITLDMFIGNKEYVGKGLAATVIKTFLSKHFSDVTEVFIDPEKRNERAVHVYQKAGFRIVGEFIASWHPVPHHVMKMVMKGRHCESQAKQSSSLL